MMNQPSDSDSASTCSSSKALRQEASDHDTTSVTGAATRTYTNRQRTAQLKRNSCLNESNSSISSSTTFLSAVSATASASASASIELEQESRSHSNQPSKKQKLHSPVTYSALQRWLYSDADSPSIVLQLLSWKDIAHLHQVCRAARSFIDNTNSANINSNKTFELTRTAHLVPSSWLHRHVRDLSNDPSRYSSFLSQLLLRLNPFSQLHKLELWCPPQSNLGQIVEAVSGLMHLRELLIEYYIGDCFLSYPSIVDTNTSFAPLRRLTHLTAFRVNTITEWCTKQQVDDIIQCTSLQHLTCGYWVKSTPQRRSDVESKSDRAAWLEQRLGRLHQLSHLQEIDIHEEILQLDSFTLLMDCKSLTTLTPLAWDIEIIRSDQFQLLTKLKYLSNIKFHADASLSDQLSSFLFHSYESVFDLPSSFFVTISRCASLTFMRLERMNINQEQLQMMMHELTNLKKLVLEQVHLGSLSPFSVSQSLEELYLDCCKDSLNKNIHWPLALPVMPQVKRCTIEDDWWRYIEYRGQRLKGMMESVINVYQLALRAKMPNAAPENVQVYLNDDSDDDDIMWDDMHDEEAIDSGIDESEASSGSGSESESESENESDSD